LTAEVGLSKSLRKRAAFAKARVLAQEPRKARNF
jgi:hypothetical protein